MRNARIARSLWAALAVAACGQDPPGQPAPVAPPAPAGGQFTRFIDLGDYRGRLEVAIVRYGDGKGVEVDLVSAVHVGDASYYADLMRRFPRYDAVLYELVAPAGTVPIKDREEAGFNPVSALQKVMRSMLRLEFQLDGIDYQQPNFVHADLAPNDIARLWEERGESLLSTLLKMMGNAQKLQMQRYAEAADQAEATGEEPRDLPRPRGREATRRAMKWGLARELGPIEEALAMFGDDDKGSGSVLLGERNKRAIEVLRRELKAGKKKVAIFYGAAHMPDMAQRLEKELGLARQSAEWVTAWLIDDDKNAAGKQEPGNGR